MERNVWVAVLLLLNFSVFTQLCLGLQNSKIISSYGSISARTLTLLSGFEDAYKADASHLGGEVWDTTEHNIHSRAAASDWETQTTEIHSGRKAVKFIITDPGIDQAKIQINIREYGNLFGSEIYGSIWFKFPSDWESTNWYNLMELCRERGVDGTTTDGKELAIEIGVWRHPDRNERWFALQKRDLQQGVRYYRHWILPLIKGQWFRIEWYIKRHPTNGIIRVWINGDLKAEKLNEMTWLSQDYYYTAPARIYTALGDVFPKILWFDDLIIADSMK